MYSHLILLTLALLCWRTINSAEDKRVAVGCLGKLPLEISEAMHGCGLSNPLGTTASPGKKRSIEQPRLRRQATTKSTTTPKPPPPSNLDKKTHDNVVCMLTKLGIVDQQGVNYTTTRRLLDRNQYQGEKQRDYWRATKKCAQDFSDYRTEAKEEITLMVDCLVDTYKKVCK